MNADFNQNNPGGDGRFLRDDESFTHWLPALLHRARQTCEEKIICQIQLAG
jgi:hypothetical protein